MTASGTAGYGTELAGYLDLGALASEPGVGQLLASFIAFLPVLLVFMRLRVGLACQEVVQDEMYLSEIPFFPGNKAT